MSLLEKILKKALKPVINNVKGKIGEAKVDSKLNPILFDKVEHRQINDLVIVDNNGKSHQIDHIEIRQNGIFCIETKNYMGWIFGSKNQDKWTQRLYTGEKHQFVNPLKQNNSHIYHIKQVLDEKYKVNSVIVMVQNNADKIKESNVINLDDLKNYLKNFDDGTNLSIEEMDVIYNKLLDFSTKMKTKNTFKTSNKHKKN